MNDTDYVRGHAAVYSYPNDVFKDNNEPSCRELAVTLLVLAALTSLVLGFSFYFSAGVAVGASGAGAIIFLGFFAGFLALILSLVKKHVVITNSEGESYSRRLEVGEFFAFRSKEKDETVNKIYVNHPLAGITEYSFQGVLAWVHTALYWKCKAQFKEILVEELMMRTSADS